MPEDCHTCNNPIFNVRGAIAEMESTVRKARADGAAAERARILAALEDEVARYSWKGDEDVPPAAVAIVFANALKAKIEAK